MIGADAQLERWWREHAASGGLPVGVAPVQGRLVRQVGRGELAGTSVFVKVMAFPRWRDRLRYLLRALPGAHEAAMLGRVAAAGIPCPEVLFVRTARRHLLPWRSLLVLRALPVAAPIDPPTPADALRQRSTLAARLLAARVLHPDLNAGNFVPLADGRLAVLDLQSARVWPWARSRRSHVQVASRLLRDVADLSPVAAAAALRAAGLLRDAAEVDAALALAQRRQWRWQRGRLLRCLTTSTEFTRTWRWCGTEHRLRAALPPGRWVRGGRELHRCWLGQRALQVLEGRAPTLPAYFRAWPWFPGVSAVYVPSQWCEDQVRQELAVAAAGYTRYREMLGGRPRPASDRS